jgi:hypothetical protein
LCAFCTVCNIPTPDSSWSFRTESNQLRGLRVVFIRVSVTCETYVFICCILCLVCTVRSGLKYACFVLPCLFEPPYGLFCLACTFVHFVDHFLVFNKEMFLLIVGSALVRTCQLEACVKCYAFAANMLYFFSYLQNCKSELFTLP